MLAVLSTSHLSIAPVDSVALRSPDPPELPELPQDTEFTEFRHGFSCSKCESLNVQERRRKNSRNVQSQVFLQNKMSNWAREKPQVTSFLRNSFPRQKSILYTLIIHHSAWHPLPSYNAHLTQNGLPCTWRNPCKIAWDKQLEASYFAHECWPKTV